MSELSAAVVALPGGLETLGELFEMLTGAQLGPHERPCGLSNVQAYFDRLLGFLDHASSKPAWMLPPCALSGASLRETS